MVNLIDLFIDGMFDIFTAPNEFMEKEINSNKEYDLGLYGDEKSDGERLYADWKAIGDDMISAMQRYEQKYRPLC